MRCTEPGMPAAAHRRREVLARVAGLFAGLAGLAGCAPHRPPPAPPPMAPPPAAAQKPPPPPAAAPPAPGAAAAPTPRRDEVVTLPPPKRARSWDDFRRQAAQRMVQARPGRSYLGEPPAVLLGIPVLEIELNGDGSVRRIQVMREPSDPRARDTIQLAIDAVRAAAPYGDVSHLPRPWRWTEVFLFDAQRRFKPRILDQ